MVEWLESNLNLVIGGGGLLAFGVFAGRYLVVRFVPSLLQKVSKVIIVIVSRMFGVDIDEAGEIVAKLPIVNKMDEVAQEMHLNNEMKLLELKQKLASPIYTRIEKIPIEKAYNYLYAQLKDKLSPEIRQALESIEEMIKD